MNTEPSINRKQHTWKCVVNKKESDKNQPSSNSSIIELNSRPIQRMKPVNCEMNPQS